MKANCYNCKYRGGIPRNAHSICHHPQAQDSDAQVKLNIHAHTYGIKRGWFQWPTNFDPTWLKNCDGFTKRE